ncbi:MAG: TonB family protein [Terriglobales bacterium]
MSTTQIPPANPAPSTPPARPPEGGDLYDARYWESAYREIVEAPALIIKLQDDLSQARRREAFWISVCVHLVVVLLLWNSQKLAGFMPRRAVVVVSPESSQKDLTYLELPPDEQKVAKRPDTNIISDKDRKATSRTPQLDRQELKKILEASRPGRPGPSGPPTPQPNSAPPAASQNPTPQPSGPPPPAPPQIAKLQTQPPAESAKAAFGGGALTAGSAIEQAARAAAANRGGYNGDGGSYGVLGQGRKPTAAMGPLEILSDTMGVDFGPYLQRVLHDVRMNWYNLIPESARAPLMKKGKVTIEFAILKDGTVAGMRLVSTSGDVALDRGAWGGITASNPFPPLPTEFGGQYLGLRFAFYYNPDRSDLQ